MGRGSVVVEQGRLGATQQGRGGTVAGDIEAGAAQETE